MNEQNQQPTVWRMLLGSEGVHESDALDEGLVFVGFGIAGDLSSKSEDAVKQIVTDSRPDLSPQQRGRMASQLNMLCNRMKVGDLIAVVLKKNVGNVAIGRVAGEYSFDATREAVPHTRKVDWVLPSVSITAEWEPYLLYLMRPNTINAIAHAETVSHVVQVVETGGEAGTQDIAAEGSEDGVLAGGSVRDIAAQQVATLIHKRFPGKKLERLVAGVLQAEGYTIAPSVGSADQGVDVLAGHGPLGFDPPLLCVQVKHEQGPTKAPAVQQLRGAMGDFGAQQGLFVSWGGYTKDAEREARRKFFTMRLWYASDLIEAVYRSYDRLPPDLRADVPLQRVWVVAPGNSGE